MFPETWTETWNMLRVIGTLLPFILLGAYLLIYIVVTVLATAKLSK
jgi:hypothetical protein